MTKLPKTLYVRMEDDLETDYPVAFESLEDAIEGDGPTEIGCYTLASTDKFQKVVMESRQVPTPSKKKAKKS